MLALILSAGIQTWFRPRNVGGRFPADRLVGDDATVGFGFVALAGVDDAALEGDAGLRSDPDCEATTSRARSATFGGAAS